MNSHILKDFPWLRSLLDTNERLTKELVESLPAEHRNFFDNMLDRVVKQAAEEWKGDEKRLIEDRGPDNRAWLKCSLCGTPNRYIFYIENRFNANRLNVGSECIKYFGLTVRRDKSMSDLIREATRIRLLGVLNEKLPGIAALVEGWSHSLEEHPVILPASLENRHVELGTKIRDLYERYLNGIIDETAIEQIALLSSNAKTLSQEIEQYVAENLNKEFAAKSEIRTWLNNRGYHQVLEMIKEDEGQITWRTAHRIEELRFVRSLVPHFSRYMEKIGLRITDVDVNSISYVLEFPSTKVRLCCKHRDFVLHYGGLIFGQDPIRPFTPKDIAAISSIYDEQSIDFVLQRLAAKARDSGVNLWGYDIEYDEMVVFDQHLGGYLILSLKSFVEQFKAVALGLQGKAVSELLQYVRNSQSRRYSRDEIKEFEEIRKSGYLPLDRG